MHSLNEFYMPPEWHRHAACWMAWPCHKATWASIGLKAARMAYARVIQAIAQFEPVKVLVNPEDLVQALEICAPEKSAYPIQFIQQTIDDSWLRDTGPTFLLSKDKTRLAGVDWIHNAWGNNYSGYAQDQKIAQFVLEQANAWRFSAPLVMEGGAFHTDGAGTLMTTRECLLHKNRNPGLSFESIENYLKNYLHIQHIIWLNQGLVDDETNGHVDEIACFIAPGKVLCLTTSDRQDANYARLQENLDILQSVQDLEIFTVEQPPATFLEDRRLTLSYINFYMANAGIVMPAFGYADFDSAAFDLFKRLFPDRQVVQVDALDIFAGGGGIHCITQQQPALS